jgi:hypothetical protein
LQASVGWSLSVVSAWRVISGGRGVGFQTFFAVSSEHGLFLGLWWDRVAGDTQSSLEILLEEFLSRHSLAYFFAFTFLNHYQAQYIHRICA